MTATAEPMTRAARRRKPRHRATFTSVLGELLLTAGTVVLLFALWQMWVGDIIIDAQQNAEGSEITAEWALGPVPEPPPLVETDDGAQYYEPPILAHPGDAEYFGQMLIPRFGEDYSKKIAGGTTRARTLDTIGIGMYTNSRMPGEVGNFSLAGHRTTWGKPFNMIDKLQLNDAIVVEVQEGWYTYRFRTMEYVKPSETDVLADVPQLLGQITGERYITLTACSPLYSLAERIVAYGVFESFQPRAEGPPAALTEPALPTAGVS